MLTENDIKAAEEAVSPVRCEGCGYLVSEREHLGCRSEKTLLEIKRLTIERDNSEMREYRMLGRENASDENFKQQHRINVELVGEIERLRSALRGMLDLDEENHQRGSGDEDICAEVRAAYEVLTPNTGDQAALKASGLD